MKTAIAMVGLGNAGAALACALSERFQLSGYDVDPQRKAAVEKSGVAWASCVEAAVVDADIVLLSLPRPEISLDVVRNLLPRK